MNETHTATACEKDLYTENIGSVEKTKEWKK